MKPFEVGGQLYDAKALEELRQEIMILRDHALEQNDFKWSVTLSHNIAILTLVIAEMSG